MLGFIAESMVCLHESEITVARLLTVTKELYPTLTAEHETKITKSKTTQAFLEQLRATSKLVYEALGGMDPSCVLEHEPTLSEPTGTLEGHPDFVTEDATKLFEVKLTGQLSKNLQYFYFQVFSYAALASDTATDIYLVLPLQQTVWHYPVRSWITDGNAAKFLEFLVTTMKTKQASNPAAMALIMSCHIGAHIAKVRSKPLADTIASLPSATPSQIFLGGPQSSKMEISDDELSAAASVLAARDLTVFVHSQYIINLCVPSDATNDAYGPRLLIKNLQYARALGVRGVVVHVGKSTTQPLDVALATMRTNLLEAIEYASDTCPILLETPAGQGSEVLTQWKEFTEFVASFGTPRIRMCVDTCHVFATGHSPLKYLRDSTEQTLLVHFNDSATPCGSCLDRHAFVGEGHIGITELTQVAHHAVSAGIPMVIE